MQKILLASLAVLLAALLGWRLALALAPQETRVRRRLEAMAAGFNETRLRPIAAGLAPDFRSEGEGLDRPALLDGLRAHFLEHARSRFPHRVELPGELLDIELRGEDTADVRLVAEFRVLRDEAWEEAWTIEVEAVMHRGEDGWQVRRADHVTLRGDRRRLR